MDDGCSPNLILKPRSEQRSDLRLEDKRETKVGQYWALVVVPVGKVVTKTGVSIRVSTLLEV